MYTLVVAGLGQLEFDRLRRESENRIAPGGKLVVTPNSAGARYSGRHASDLISRAHAIAASLNEVERLSTLLIYVDYEDATTKSLLDAFFPFCIPLGVKPLDLSGITSKRVINERLNAFTDRIIAASKRLRDRSRILSGITDVANLTPILLPIRNFRSEGLSVLIRTLYEGLAEAESPKEFIEDAVKVFFSRNPRVYPPGDARHCFSDGRMYFKSPGKNRHGYFRNISSESHQRTCLLNARSRVGGAYDYRLHYDCTPTKGGLSGSYDNCHGHPTAPKASHVNIAPNDYII